MNRKDFSGWLDWLEDFLILHMRIYNKLNFNTIPICSDTDR